VTAAWSPIVDRSQIWFGHTQRVNSATVSRTVLFDVDGTLIDAANNQRRVWALAAAIRSSARRLDPPSGCLAFS
jgi:hypothetical protein